MSMDHASSRRLFIGLMPDAAAQTMIERHTQDWQWPPQARLTVPQRLHLTLHFLGNIEAPRERALRESLRQVHFQPFTLTLGIPEVWRDGVAVLRSVQAAGLTALRESLGQAMLQVRIMPEQRFTPHVTLSRRAKQATPPRVTIPITWKVHEFALVWSCLTPFARYEVLERFRADPINEDQPH